ncbi:hypothetical protein CCR91_20000 [Thiorhodovibrio winogradskyi]|nr:hypothetical protein [Thiorhodovibrio winogradskyi]
MVEIKRRIEVISSLIRKEIAVKYHATHVETMVLQLRMILELIALSSLAANREIFEANRRKFEDHWRVSKIIKDVEALNQNFYPMPILQLETPGGPAEQEFILRADGFLTKDELVEVHGRCGAVLHAANPYGKKANYGQFEQEVPTWVTKVMTLLADHKIQLLDDESFYFVRMEDPTDKRVHLWTYGRAQP